jgi:hypothetical protein
VPIRECHQGVVLAQLGVAFVRLGLTAGDRLLEGFQARLQLFFRKTFGSGTELHSPQLEQQTARPVILCL